MAVTKIIPIRTTIQNSVEYICNPDKTDNRLLVHSENCFPNTAALEFHHYLSQTRAGGNTIGRHLIQSFAPGEATPEQAHEIGKRLAADILKGEYAFVMATHVDRGHIHNHFVWCAANIVTHKRYRSNKTTYHEIRQASDRLCKENELSVIVPQGYGKSFGAYSPDQTSGSWKAKLQAAIDSLIPEAKDFTDFLKRMETLGYKVKRGKHISFSAEGQERYTRAKSLGEGYTEEAIKRKISEKPEPLAEEKTVAPAQPPTLITPPPITPPPQPKPQTAPLPPQPKPQTAPPPKPQPTPKPPATPPQAKPQTAPLPPQAKPQTTPPPKPQAAPKPPAAPPPIEKPTLLDIAGNPKNAANRGLEQWARLQKLGYTVDAFNLMKEYGGRQAFNKIYSACKTDVETIENGIKANKERIDAYRYLRKDVETFHRTKDVYKQYKETKFFKERFYKKHQGEIIEHENALIGLRDYERPLPKLKLIDERIQQLKDANVINNKGLAKKKAETNQAGLVYSYLYKLEKEHEPPTPPRERTQTRKKSYDMSR